MNDSIKQIRDLKVVILGTHNVGKTSLITRYCNGTFLSSIYPTLGAGFYTRALTMKDEEINVMLWDTSGEERFLSITPSFSRGASGLILVFDITSKETLSSLDIYLDLFRDNADVSSSNVPVLVLANKCDLVEEQFVPDDLINNYLKHHQLRNFAKVSAKDGTNVEESITEFIKSIKIPTPQPFNTFSLSPDSDNDEKTSNCSC